MAAPSPARFPARPGAAAYIPAAALVFVSGDPREARQARVIARPETDWLAHAWLKPEDASPATAGETS